MQKVKCGVIAYNVNAPVKIYTLDVKKLNVLKVVHAHLEPFLMMESVFLKMTVHVIMLVKAITISTLSPKIAMTGKSMSALLQVARLAILTT